MPEAISPLMMARTFRGLAMNQRAAPPSAWFDQETVAVRSQPDGIIDRKYHKYRENNSRYQEDIRGGFNELVTCVRVSGRNWNSFTIPGYRFSNSADKASRLSFCT